MSARVRVGLSLLIAGVATLGLVGASWLPPLWESTLPLSEVIARNGGQWRTVSLRGRAAERVVVFRSSRWSGCPGLGVAAQTAAVRVDSAFAVNSALLQAFRLEAERGPGRCFTVQLEVGSGRHWPWASPTRYAFTWYHKSAGGSWMPFGYAGPGAGSLTEEIFLQGGQIISNPAQWGLH